MKLEDMIQKKVQGLPELVQREVLTFVEYLAQRDTAEDADWSEISLTGAVRGTENESWPDYSDADLKDHWA